MDALQEFEYEHKIYSTEFKPAKIVDSLLAHAGHSLRCLDLTAPKECGSGWVKFPGFVYTGSLRGFQVLKVVRVNIVCFIESTINPDTKKISSKVHRLVDQLPACIEKLSLVGDLETWWSGCLDRTYLESSWSCSLDRMFDDLKESKADLLPDLEVIEIDNFNPVVIQACHEAGIELVFEVNPQLSPSAWSGSDLDEFNDLDLNSWM